MTRYDGMQLRFAWCGQNVSVEFKGGDGRHRAKFMTSNLFVQDAIEHDVRYGGLVVLVSAYEDTPEGKKEAVEEKPKRRITRVKSINDAMRWLTENGYNPTGEEDLDALMEKANVEFPNLKK